LLFAAAAEPLVEDQRRARCRATVCGMCSAERRYVQDRIERNLDNDRADGRLAIPCATGMRDDRLCETRVSSLPVCQSGGSSCSLLVTSSRSQIVRPSAVNFPARRVFLPSLRANLGRSLGRHGPAYNTRWRRRRSGHIPTGRRRARVGLCNRQITLLGDSG
jgi:hypothetical protein